MKKYLDLIKFNLTFLVIFSYLVSYILATPRGQVDLLDLFYLIIGGFCIAGSGNAANQLVEYNTDKLMQRTKKRPIVSGAISFSQAKWFIILSLIIGLSMIWTLFNLNAALLAALSFFIYVYIYTPLKKKTAIAVLIGAVPGALPCLVGWVAYTDSLDAFGWILFSIQFFWQLPHFWSLAWLVDEDYKKAGYHLLPFGMRPSRIVAIQTLAFSLLLIIVSLLPYLAGYTNVESLYLIMVADLLLLWVSIRLVIKPISKSAKQLMFYCYLYLPLVFLSLLLFRN